MNIYSDTEKAKHIYWGTKKIKPESHRKTKQDKCAFSLLFRVSFAHFILERFWSTFSIAAVVAHLSIQSTGCMGPSERSSKAQRSPKTRRKTDVQILPTPSFCMSASLIFASGERRASNQLRQEQTNTNLSQVFSMEQICYTCLQILTIFFFWWWSGPAMEKESLWAVCTVPTSTCDSAA